MTTATETVTPPAAVPGTKVQDTPEFKEALAQAREQERVNLEAEYRRKEREREETRTPAAPPAQPGPDYFTTWGERHGLPADAGRELVAGVVDYVTGELLPKALKPLSESAKRQELRSQRTELRATNPKLAKLDDRYHKEALRRLDLLKPEQLGPDSYARALHMVIGEHVLEIDSERTDAAAQAAEEQRQPVAPGPEPMPSSGSAKTQKLVLNAAQRQFCDDKGMAEADFVEMMVERARNLEVKQGLTKNQVRARLGALLGTLEF